MNAVDQIQQVLSGIDSGRKNNAAGHYLNIIKNEFIRFGTRVLIPKISVKELDYSTAAGIVADAAAVIPEYLQGHRLLAERNPPSEQHNLQFVRRIRGTLIDFIHMFKIDLKFGGGASEYVDRGGPDYYPSYYTDRYYYKSRLVPVPLHKSSGGDDVFLPIRIFDSTFTESDQYFHTFAMFEDINYKEITGEMYKRLDLPGVFPISQELFPFIEFEYFTGCLNVINPLPMELEMAAAFFEPLFLLLYSRYRDISVIAPPAEIPGVFPAVIHDEGGGLRLSSEFIEKLKEYFGRYSLVRDDDLVMKGWWRIDCVE